MAHYGAHYVVRVIRYRHYDPGMDDGKDGVLVPFDSYDQIQGSLRPELAARLSTLWQALAPYVDGTFGDVDPRHAAVAVQLIKELGRLYRVYDRPQVVVEGFTEEQVRARIAEAVSVAVSLARSEWEAQRRIVGADARSLILEQLRDPDQAS